MNKLVDQYNNTYICSINKKPVDADYSALTEEIESTYKPHKFKAGESEFLSITIVSVKVTPKIGPEKNLLLVLL